MYDLYHTLIINQTLNKYIMKTLTIFCYTTLILTILLFTGRVKYVNACDACALCEGTDQAIENTLYDHGFNIGWNDEPTATDYIISNFK